VPTIFLIEWWACRRPRSRPAALPTLRLVINSPEELDVVAVYSGNPKGGEVSTLDTETVAARKIAKVIKIEPDKSKLQPEKRIPAEPFVTIKP
jgi:hypothetical protein